MTWPFENDTSAITKKLAKKAVIRFSARIVYSRLNSRNGQIMRMYFINKFMNLSIQSMYYKVIN